MKMKTIVLLSLVMTGCLSTIGLAEASVVVGTKTWGRIDNGWDASQCAVFCAAEGTGANIAVKDGPCSFNMDPDACECIGHDQAQQAGVLPGCWCYGTVLSTNNGGQGCDNANPPNWPPIH